MGRIEKENQNIKIERKTQTLKDERKNAENSKASQKWAKKIHKRQKH